MLAEALETGRDTSLSRYNDVFAILYSSGTTGRPKGIMLPNAHIYSFGINWIATTNLQDDALYAPLSLFYMQPMILGVVPVLMVGAQVHIAERFSATRYWAEIRRAEATIAHRAVHAYPDPAQGAPQRSGPSASLARVHRQEQRGVRGQVRSTPY